VDDLAATLADLHVRGLRIVGSEADAPLTAREADLRGPIALVVGSEGHGLAPAVRRRCDQMVRIPMRGAIGSLNAAVAGSILAYEVVAQRSATSGAEVRASAAMAPATPPPAPPAARSRRARASRGEPARPAGPAAPPAPEPAAADALLPDEPSEPAVASPPPARARTPRRPHSASGDSAPGDA
jgi:23S rRNA (guanosine2251-2'-O)-methyltransferase